MKQAGLTFLVLAALVFFGSFRPPQLADSTTECAARTSSAPVTPGFKLPWTAGDARHVSQTWGTDCQSCHQDQPNFCWHGCDCNRYNCYAYDFWLTRGTIVRASAAGTVTAAQPSEPQGSCGGAVKQVKISHAGGWESVYMHLDSVAVSAGNEVWPGKVIGTSGCTGLSTGEHLHFQLNKDGTSQPFSFDEYPGQSLYYNQSVTSSNYEAPPTPTPNPDVDGDGMPNAYEQAYACLNSNVADGSGDADHDEFTSLAEYVLGSNPCRDSIQVTYSANAGWTDAGVGLTAGEWFSSSATGVAYVSGGGLPYSPSGNPANPDYGWNNCTEGELVGYIGTAVPDPNNWGQPNVIRLGAGTAVVAPTTGRLYLAMNDPGTFSDNSGSWTVEITRQGMLKYRASSGWLDTELAMSTGANVSVTALGNARFHGGSALTGPDGSAPGPFGWAGCRETELVSVIAATPPDPNTVPLSGVVCIGAIGSFVASASGDLYLAMNDPGYFADNSGRWSIRVSSTGPTPAPVGGIAEYPQIVPPAAASGGGTGSRSTLTVAAIVGGVVLLAAGASFARSR